ncbi:MAG: SIMPL domain-containing protein [Pseudomonadales bacterium]
MNLRKVTTRQTSAQRSALLRFLPGALLLVFLPLQFAVAEEGIHVSGRGSVEVAPDVGDVPLHARREGTDAAALIRELNTVVRSVLKLTAKLGIEERDVTATAVSINPRYRRQDQDMVVDGLVATRSIQVRLRNLDQFGPLMTQSLDAGINNVEPMQLDSSRRDELENEALTLAIRAAKEEAARVAEAFGVGLGAVANVQVDGRAPVVKRSTGMMAMRAEADDGGAFSAGLIRIERFVQATFRIQPTDDAPAAAAE